ncbi:MAG: NAD(P)/FAD-dependent oxidoreductase [Corallococcus sp.]|nr:NAD(P)/FAD-dependent oxidoreductase [Corallococcus sp.]MCM1359684.1 NAD(P)/FAD-dependent oxidoreductase [Corallococcus sp.]MCM1395393.1 NAD(P)/FAD-dependent oxidoreductase [Corallococcus sp.]
MDIVVIGGGPAGMMSAVAAANCGARVTLMEKNEKLGKKLYISGKGRCNVTNDCAVADFLPNVVTSPKFLQGALHRFSPQNTIDFCSEHGLLLKVERGNRVFPQSDKSSDVIKTFTKALEEERVSVLLGCEVFSVSYFGQGFLLQTSAGVRSCDKVIVATGGYSYRTTGSDGFGYCVARDFGHTVVDPKPALCRILCKGTSALEGLSLKNVQISFVAEGKTVASEFGEMLFTDDGVSGPAALTLSSRVTSFVHYDSRRARSAQVCLDLKPALSSEKLDDRVLRDFSERMNKNFENALDALLPARLVGEVVRQCGIFPDKKVNKISAAERTDLVSTLKNLSFPFVGLDDVNNAIVTCGGVDVREIDPKTMQSKLQKGLYFAGEVLDVDALTGGYNIQIALSTGYVSGISASLEE